MARSIAEAYRDSREALGFPLIASVARQNGAA
jgi:hypothetical protein